MVIGDEAGRAASLLASVGHLQELLRLKSLLKCCDPNEPRMLSNINQGSLANNYPVCIMHQHVNNKFSATIFFYHMWFDTSTVVK